MVVPETMRGITADRIQDPEWGAAQLERIPVFRVFSHDQLRKVYELGAIRKVKEGAHVVVEGEPTRGLFLLVQGAVSVYKTDSGSGQMFRIAILEEGSYFGELSLFDSAPRSATVRAEASCTLFALDASHFEAYLGSTSKEVEINFYKQCARDMVERFRSLNQDYITSQQMLWKYALRRTDDQSDGGKTVIKTAAKAGAPGASKAGGTNPGQRPGPPKSGAPKPAQRPVAQRPAGSPPPVQKTAPKA